MGGVFGERAVRLFSFRLVMACGWQLKKCCRGREWLKPCGMRRGPAALRGGPTKRRRMHAAGSKAP